ncbi:Kv channel-interacting protein 1 isoform X1 [Frankliniella occidentalis]|uniref:Kv channel-interacting protein 1 isoform X1 n=1 Tax=Frankliniella occidentalis TaxID=133901 RepID=A0A9C6WZC1_FRAOC|nr:Kv channel-interacting protein 1 isoform X1 [Frankliniella occidentalis]
MVGHGASQPLAVAHGDPLLRGVEVHAHAELREHDLQLLQDEAATLEIQECPEGVVQEDAFKDIYAKFFPHGNSSLYAHYVFKAFDVNCNGAITFRDLLVTLSTLLRGSIYEKLRWTFKLYDINGDGCITRSELTEIVVAIHELMGRRAHQVEDDRKCREQVDRVFRKLDLNQDGVITIEEFMESCLKDEIITRSMAMFDTSL